MDFKTACVEIAAFRTRMSSALVGGGGRSFRRVYQ